MGVMMGVGSYLPIDAPLRRIALTVVIVDTVFSLLVRLAVMAVVLGAGLQPTTGITLMFKTLQRAIGCSFGRARFATGLFLMTLIVTSTRSEEQSYKLQSLLRVTETDISSNNKKQ